jgi:protoheme IX farnesyltransferase
MSASDTSTSTSSDRTERAPSTMSDLMLLTKFRLSAMVIVTTFVGFWLNSPDGIHVGLLLHTLLGSTLAAFGAAVFNQLMEVEADRRMNRTADRPLPARRIEPGMAFGLGWLLSAFALIHLSRMVNLESAVICAMTLAVYLFVYTPMKQQSAWNTVVGAVSGALPPLIGWAGAVGQPVAGDRYFRWELFIDAGAVYLFLLLFFWQLPHFVAINWMYRDEYRKGGFVMWANDDDTGRKTATLAMIFSLCALASCLIPPLAGLTNFWFLPLALLVNAALLWFSRRFFVVRDRPSARKLFFFTLLYLPVMLGLSIVLWRK